MFDGKETNWRGWDIEVIEYQKPRGKGGNTAVEEEEREDTVAEEEEGDMVGTISRKSEWF